MLIHAKSFVRICIIKTVIKKVCIVEYIINYLKPLFKNTKSHIGTN